MKNILYLIIAVMIMSCSSPLIKGKPNQPLSKANRESFKKATNLNNVFFWDEVEYMKELKIMREYCGFESFTFNEKSLNSPNGSYFMGGEVWGRVPKFDGGVIVYFDLKNQVYSKFEKIKKCFPTTLSSEKNLSEEIKKCETDVGKCLSLYFSSSDLPDITLDFAKTQICKIKSNEIIQNTFECKKVNRKNLKQALIAYQNEEAQKEKSLNEQKAKEVLEKKIENAKAEKEAREEKIRLAQEVKEEKVRLAKEAKEERARLAQEAKEQKEKDKRSAIVSKKIVQCESGNENICWDLYKGNLSSNPAEAYKFLGKACLFGSSKACNVKTTLDNSTEIERRKQNEIKEQNAREALAEQEEQNRRFQAIQQATSCFNTNIYDHCDRPDCPGYSTCMNNKATKCKSYNDGVGNVITECK